jgi:hypothetical protein
MYVCTYVNANECIFPIDMSRFAEYITGLESKCLSLEAQVKAHEAATNNQVEEEGRNRSSSNDRNTDSDGDENLQVIEELEQRLDKAQTKIKQSEAARENAERDAAKCRAELQVFRDQFTKMQDSYKADTAEGVTARARRGREVTKLGLTLSSREEELTQQLKLKASQLHAVTTRMEALEKSAKEEVRSVVFD